MYAVAMRVTPASLRAIAAQLCVELLRGGYTQVCEFHYLHHASDDSHYADPLAMSCALADAAADVAIHSLRAAEPSSIARLLECVNDDGPIHIQVAEQTVEVDDCLAATGSRPIEWLARQVGLDARWQLVHATAREIDAVAKSGAGVVVCPSSEANLGDGITDLRGWLDAGVPLAIGSDSHVTRDWREDLRLAEYGQRLVQRRRNVAAAPERGLPSSAEHLWCRVLGGGAAAAGFARWGLLAGARADLLVMDPADAATLGVPASHLLDALVFSSPGRPWLNIMVAGRWTIGPAAKS